LQVRLRSVQVLRYHALNTYQGGVVVKISVVTIKANRAGLVPAAVWALALSQAKAVRPIDALASLTHAYRSIRIDITMAVCNNDTNCG